jgi:tetratricopeptide (TPR) repeat protein
MATDTAPHSARRPRYEPPRTLWQIPTFLLGAGAVVAVVFGRNAWHGDDLATARREVAAARAALEQPKPNAAAAIEAADKAVLALRRIAPVDPQVCAEAHFLLGSAHLRRGDEAGDSAEERRLARTELFEAVERDKLPDTDRPKLDYRRAKVSALLNEEPRKVLDLLKPIAEAGTAEDPVEGYGLLAMTYLRLTPADVQSAYDATTKQVQSLPATDTRWAHPARIRQADLLLKLGRGAEARPILERIESNAPAEVFFAARNTLAQSYEESQEWVKAAKCWAQVEADAQLKPAERAAIAYRRGRCLAQDKERSKDAPAAWEDAIRFGGPAARAAALRLAEAKTESGPPAATLDAFAVALGGMTAPDQWPAALLPVAEARHTIARVFQQLQSRGEYDAALKLAELFKPLAPPGDAAAMAGLVADDRAQALTAQAKQATPDAVAGLQEQARAQYALAAKAYEAAAGEAPPGPFQSNWLINSADRYARAGQPDEAATVLGKLAQAGGVADEHVAAAWFVIAEAQSQRREMAKAREAYAKSMAVAGPNQAKARLQVASADLAENKLDDAEKALTENQAALKAAAQPDTATLALTEYALADVAYERENRKPDDEPRDYATAEQRFLAAVQQYPDSPAAAKARHCLGKVYWYTAVQRNRAARAPDVTDDERKLKNKQMAEALQKAVEQFDLSEKLLLARQKAGPLDAAESELLYMSSWAAAESNFFLGRHDEAIRRYSVLVERHPQQVEELAALSQIWQSYVYYLKQPEQGRAVLARFRSALEKMPDTAFTGATQNHKREVWVERLAAMEKQSGAAGQ